VRRNQSAVYGQVTINALGEISMRSPAIAFAFVIAAAFSGYAFAEPQPLTRADCESAGMTWNDGTNVCGTDDAAASEAATPADDSGDMVAVAQPLTRADCEKASMQWNNSTNVCGSSQGAAAVPDAAAEAAAAPAPAVMPEKKKREFRKGEKKIVKKVKARHGTKKTVVHKKPRKHPQSAAKKEQRGFFKWLRQQEKNEKKS
jgi:hypothetical protein